MDSPESKPQELILSIPTYDGTGQVVHPDILYYQDAQGNHCYYLVATPYPYGNNKFENPSLYISQDGIRFNEPYKNMNPLVKAPLRGFNCDPDLSYDVKSQNFRIYYMETQRPDSQNIILLQSQDTKNWTRQRVIHNELTNKRIFFLSPAVICKDSLYYMFWVNVSGQVPAIQFYISPDGINWDLSHSDTIQTVYPEKFYPWHIDIIEYKNRYYLLCSGTFYNPDLYLAVSPDLVHWEFTTRPLLQHSPQFYYSRQIYRSTGIIKNDQLLLWFSFQTLNQEWLIGFKRYALARILTDYF